MAITGAVGAALRQEAPYQAEIQMGAQLIMDYQGARSGRRPYYWYRGTRYTRPEKIPGWSFARASAGYAEDSDGNLIAFPANEPRITDKGLLIEESRANTILNSLAPGGSGWSLLNASVVPNGLVAPDGSPTASAITNTGGTVGGFYRDSGITLNASQSYTTSGFFRYVSGGTTVQLIVASQSVFGWAGGDRYINFNATTGQLVTKSAEITSYTITRYANGWWRVSGTFTPTSTGISNVGAYSTSAASIFGAWGLQFETGSFATSYIPTTSAAATRAADSTTISGLGAILAAPFTLVAWADLPAADGVTRYLAQAAQNSTNRIVLSREAVGNALMAFSIADSGSANSSAGAKVGARVVKAAFRSDPTASRFAADGVVLPAITPVPPAGLSRIDIGWGGGPSGYLDGFAQRIVVLGGADEFQMTRLVA